MEVFFKENNRSIATLLLGVVLLTIVASPEWVKMIGILVGIATLLVFCRLFLMPELVTAWAWIEAKAQEYTHGTGPDETSSPEERGETEDS